MIEEAVSEVERLQGNIPRIAEGPVQIPDIKIPENPAAGSLKLSREGISIIARTIEKGAAADSFESALEIGYQGAGDIACTDAAKEGISAFLEKRKPSFEK
jgi:enoyl-CoA hydratase/3-hydroxyacyl-CoA dehydrogenase